MGDTGQGKAAYPTFDFSIKNILVNTPYRAEPTLC